MQIQTVTLNVVPNGVPPIIDVTQNDNGRIIQIALKNGSAAYSLPSRYTYVLCGTKPTGTGFSYDNAVSVVGSNTLSFNTNTVMTAVAGDVRCGIIIYDGDEHVETLNFILRVQRTALESGTIIDSSDFESAIRSAVKEFFEEASGDMIGVGNIIPWKTSEAYPTGWQTGYYSGSVGTENWTHVSSSKYLCSRFVINTNNYPEFKYAMYMKICPPEGYAVCVRERGDNGIERIKGQIDTSTHPEAAGAELFMDVDPNKAYVVSIGRWANNDCADYLTESFINSIDLIFYERVNQTVIDDTLSIEGAAADAKAVGDAIAGIIETEITAHDWRINATTGHPLGWMGGYIASSTGEFKKSKFWLRTLNYQKRYSTDEGGIFAGASSFTATAPTGYIIRVSIFQHSTKTLLDNVTSVTSGSVTVNCEVDRYYAFTVGRFDDANSEDYLTDSFVDSIGLDITHVVIREDRLPQKDKTIKILGIGNSWMRDTCRHLCTILNNAGYDVKIVQAYLGGSGLPDQYFGMLSSTYAYTHSGQQQIVHSTYQSWTYVNSDTPIKNPASGYNNGLAGTGVTLESIIESDTWDYIILMNAQGRAGRIEGIYDSAISVTVDIEDHISEDEDEWDSVGDIRTWDIREFVKKILRHCTSDPDIYVSIPWCIAEGSAVATWANLITYYNDGVTPTTDEGWHALYVKVHGLFQDYGSQTAAYLGNLCSGIVNPGLAIYYARESEVLKGFGYEMQRSNSDTHLADGLPKYTAGFAVASGITETTVQDVSYYPASGTDDDMSGSDGGSQSNVSTPTTATAYMCRVAAVKAANELPWTYSESVQ